MFSLDGILSPQNQNATRKKACEAIQTVSILLFGGFKLCLFVLTNPSGCWTSPIMVQIISLGDVQSVMLFVLDT